MIFQSPNNFPESQDKEANMSTGTSPELDFFRMEKANSSSKSHLQMLLNQRRNVRGFNRSPSHLSFTGVQTAISNMNPQFLKSLITDSGLSPVKEVISPPNNAANLLLGMENLPVFSPISRNAVDPEKINAPLTIFYNGTVCVFDLSHDKAEMILKLAEEGKPKILESASLPEPKLNTDSSRNQDEQLLEKLNGDLRIARKKSLQRFLAKRKERLTTISPYTRVGSDYGADK